MSTIASAPGKIYLIGEHAVVYGEPAIIAAIGIRTKVTVEKSDVVRYIDTRFDFDESWPLDEIRDATDEVLSFWKLGQDSKNFSSLFDLIKSDGYKKYKQSVVGVALSKLNIEGGIALKIESEIPTGAGVGSSAAFHVALVKAISQEYDIEISNENVNDIAYEMEKIIHGNPSGGDNSACCFGRLLWFQKSQPKNIIKSLESEIPYSLKNFILVYTGPPIMTTGELVQKVRDLDENFRMERVNEIGLMTHELIRALQKKNFNTMKEIINSTQKDLEELGVSTPQIDEIAAAIRNIGGAAKLCGAGGGGVMLCYHEHKEELKELLKSLGYDSIEADLAVEGVRLEE